MRAYGEALRVLTILLLLTVLPGRALASASDGERTVVATPAALLASGDVRVHYRLDWSVATRYDATVMITNMTLDTIDSWTLEFDLFPVIDRMDNVAWSVDGTRHTVRGVGPMKSIAPGGMVWFTFSADWIGSTIETPAVCVFNGAGCTVEVVSPPPVNPQTELPVKIAWWVSWQGLTQYRSQVIVKNTSEDPIDYWTMQFTSDALVTRIEHVSSSVTGTLFDVAGKGWTRRIEPGEIAWFTMDGVYYGTEVARPDDCVFNGFECEFLDPEDLFQKEDPTVPFGGYCTLPDDEVESAKPEDIEIDFQFASLWATGYTATVLITNNATDRPLKDWKLEFEMPSAMTVTLFWNGDLTRDGTHYTVTSLIHNSCVEPGVSVTFGFEGRHAGVATKPTMCSLDGSSCVFLRFASSTAVENRDTADPDGFLLDAPFPNPFSNTAVVPFSVERTQHVDLTVWDMQGRLVASPFSGVVVAGQAAEARIDGHGLPPGAYLLRLAGDSGQTTTRQLMLVH